MTDKSPLSPIRSLYTQYRSAMILSSLYDLKPYPDIQGSKGFDTNQSFQLSVSGQIDLLILIGEGNGTPLQYSCLENPMDGRAWQAAVHGVTKSRTQLSDFPFTFHFHALEKEMATHSSVLAWRIPGTGELGGLLSTGFHRVGHDWSDLAAAYFLWMPHTLTNVKTLCPAICWNVLYRSTESVLSGSLWEKHHFRSPPKPIQFESAFWQDFQVMHLHIKFWESL